MQTTTDPSARTTARTLIASVHVDVEYRYYGPCDRSCAEDCTHHDSDRVLAHLYDDKTIEFDWHGDALVSPDTAWEEASEAFEAHAKASGEPLRSRIATALIAIWPDCADDIRSGCGLD